MSEKEKSITDSALLDLKKINEAIAANTKEILRSVAIEEINKVVEESLNKDYIEEVIDDEEDVEMDDTETMDDVLDTDVDSDVDGIEMDADNLDTDIEGEFEVGMDTEVSDDEVEMDMTSATDDEIIAIYKKLTGDDTIEVVIDDEKDEINIDVKEPGEFMVKRNLTQDFTEDNIGDEISSDMNIEDAIGEIDSEEMSNDIQDEEIVYEIALDEMENIDGIKAPITDELGDNLAGGFDENKTHAKAEGDMVMTEEEVVEEEEVSEKIQVGKGRTVANTSTEIKGAGGKANNVTTPNVTAVSEMQLKYKNVLSENEKLKKRVDEYQSALKNFRNMLAETVVFNTNLANVTRLFMEHSTTKDEKASIFKRFDTEVSTIKESKKLFKVLDSELSSRKPIKESIENKLIKESGSSTSKQLNEATAYVDKETSRIIDLMRRVSGK
jgi:hypothetical protein